MLYAKFTIIAMNACLIQSANSLADISCAYCTLALGPQFHSGNFPIESIRAANLAGEPRERRFCSECKPHLCDEDGPDIEEIFEVIYEYDFRSAWCLCTLAGEFIEEEWLCIPCFFKREAESYSRRLKKQFFKWETSEDGSRKLVRTEVCCLSPTADHC